MNDQRPSVLDIFSGAGGTAWGFLRAGFRIVAAVEKDPQAAATYRTNIGVQPKVTDITLLDPGGFREEIGLRPGDLDVLIGCPPCQGFTRMRNAEGAGDRRNPLVLRYLEYVREFMPRFAVFENVPGLARTEHGRRFYEALLDGLDKLGYAVVRRIVDAADYGVPQHRRRIVIIAGFDGEKLPFPEPTHADPRSREVARGVKRPWTTVRQAIGDYPPLRAGEERGSPPNHRARAMGERVLDFIRRVPHDGGSRTDVPERFWLPCHKRHSGHKDVYGRLAWDRPSNVITSGCTNVSKGRFVHPVQDRGLSVREAAALQGFPDEFVFRGGLDSMSWQIGNAVPPPLAEAVARVLMERLNGARTHIPE